jgi:NTP pyrophosphatase (non-canonical NTP hydrolase)
MLRNKYKTVKKGNRKVEERKIAKYRDERVPGYWLVTDFTMEQVEGALKNYENCIKEENVSFDYYDYRASQTDVGTSAQDNMKPGWLYYVLGILGEAGELSEKVKKLFRDHNGVLTDQYREEILKELGDILWYVSRLAVVLGSSLAKIALMNLFKLKSRKKRNKIHGDGDNR